MDAMHRNPKIGLLLPVSPRFKELGAGTASGTYHTRKLQEIRQIVAAFSQKMDVVETGLCYSQEDAFAAVDTFREQKVDAVVVSFLSWSEDCAWIHALSQLADFPLLYGTIVRPQIPYADTQDENDFVDFLSCGSLVGFLEGSGSLRRLRSSMYEVFVGSLEEFVDRALIFARASKARSQLRGCVVSLLSHFNEAMWSTYVDPYSLFSTFGITLHFLSIAELLTTIDNTQDAEAIRYRDQLAATYPTLPDVDPDKFLASVKATLAMERLAQSVATDLLVLNDIEKPLLEQVGLRPGFSPLTGPITVVPEGDIGAGLAVLLLKLLSGQHTNFIEPFYMDKARNVFAAGHAGPNDYTQVPENVKIGRDTRFAKSNYKYAGAPFAWYVYPAGLKTILHISQCNGKFKLAFSTVECLPTEHYLCSYSHADFRHTHLSNEEFFKKLGEFGVTQHYAITDGDWTQELEAFAKLYDLEYLKV